MEIKYGVTGKQRKALVDAIAEITGAKAIYKGVPSCNYEVDYFTIDRYGTLIFDDLADSAEVERLLEELERREFIAGYNATDKNTERTPSQQESISTTVEGFSIGIPRDKVNIANLENLLSSKKTLICKALGVENFPIDVGESKVEFPWFTQLPEADTVKAYTHFIAAICEMSLTQKRISSAEKIPENEKYAFRCFLLRLGFIGAEYKEERKILLQNLSGSSAFKNGEKRGGEQ